MKNRKWMLLFIIGLVVTSIIVNIIVKPKLGLDLVGGSRLVLEAQTTPAVPKITPDIMSSLRYAIEKRVNALGVAETTVQPAGDKRLIVEIPNISDPQKAKQYLGETASLEFKEQKPGFNGQPVWIDTGLTGRDLKKAAIGSDQTTGELSVQLEFNAAGTRKFGDLTTRLVGKPMAIFFNGKLQSAPVIQEPIMGGQAQITGGEGGFTIEEAQDTVNLLNAGALPVPAQIIEENSVGPTLGQDSINKSLIAGIVGIVAVMVFMLTYYRFPGAIACIALIIYALVTFMLFKIPRMEVVLSLAGIAGFILSIGMAVDANILIFERTKEELRAGRTLFTAINAGFDRAFTSIFDSNMSTLLTCTVLFLLGTSFVKGFALTLAIGVAVSMFTAITVTRTFMHLVFGAGQLTHPEWFGLKPDEISKNASVEDTSPRKARLGVLD